MGLQVGYKRVSSADQKTDRQLDGVSLEKVFEDHASARDTDRPGLRACLSFLREGDVLHVHSIDRLARNLKHLQELVTDLAQKKVAIVFHQERLHFTADETAPMDRLILQIFGAVSEFERALIRERQREGIAKAKALGRALGRPSALTAKTCRELARRRAEGEAVKSLMESYRISRATLYRALKARPEEESEKTAGQTVSVQ